jgi:hypothetical protein
VGGERSCLVFEREVVAVCLPSRGKERVFAGVFEGKTSECFAADTDDVRQNPDCGEAEGLRSNGAMGPGSAPPGERGLARPKGILICLLHASRWRLLEREDRPPLLIACP